MRRDPADAETAAAVHELVGEHPRALLILGAAKMSQLMTLYEHYGPLVPVGSYIVLRGHDPERASRLDRVRPGTLGGGEADRRRRRVRARRRRWSAFAHLQPRGFPEAGEGGRLVKVFGIGLNKTGTSSLHRALELLGYRSLHWGRSRDARAHDPRNRRARADAALHRPRTGCDLGRARDHLLLLPRRRPVPRLEVHPHAARHGRVGRQPPPARRAQPANEGSRRVRRPVPHGGPRHVGGGVPAARSSRARLLRTQAGGPARLPAGGRRLGAAVQRSSAIPSRMRPSRGRTEIRQRRSPT